LQGALQREGARVFFDFAARTSVGATRKKDLATTLIADEGTCILSATSQRGAKKFKPLS
jgi:hypothetical protein